MVAALLLLVLLVLLDRRITLNLGVELGLIALDEVQCAGVRKQMDGPVFVGPSIGKSARFEKSNRAHGHTLTISSTVAASESLAGA